MKKYILALFVALGLQSVHAKESVKNIDLKVTENGFEPSEIKVTPGTHIVLNVTRKTDVTCATQIKIKEKNIMQELPLNKTVKVDLGVLKKGDVRFACGMDMISGHIIAE
ncbi:MAG: cupredoxin domain-containing protein [Bdellovibrionaceae bacterium]|nr:cupredoxin domain-containing protein [Pseudobdellovibrionaceae bacterium]NUM60333.1 cupredoxin domain-containing protein [Pseudobdellovibrionaceae bacterium]